MPVNTTVLPILPDAEIKISPFLGYGYFDLKFSNNSLEINASGVPPNVPILKNGISPDSPV